MGTKRQRPLRKLGKVAISEDPKPEDRPDDTGLRLDTTGPSSLRRPSINNADPKPVSARIFDDAERQALYDIIEALRDVRNEFLPDKIEPGALMRILRAAHNAPSVGFMQPWNFIMIDDPVQKQKVHEAFTDANAEAEQMFSKDRQETYRSLKLEGIKNPP
jgi:5,6-dimethylbenzimidazole synthase